MFKKMSQLILIIIFLVHGTIQEASKILRNQKLILQMNFWLKNP